MRKFNLATRIRRCRNISGTDERVGTRQIGQQYDPESSPQIGDMVFAPGVSTKLYSVLDDDLFCRMCGVMPGDIDDVTGQKVKLHIEYVKDRNLDEKDEMSNLQVQCSTCYQGAKE